MAVWNWKFRCDPFSPILWWKLCAQQPVVWIRIFRILYDEMEILTVNCQLDVMVGPSGRVLRRWRGSAPMWCSNQRESNPLRMTIIPMPKTSSAILKILIQIQMKAGEIYIESCQGEDAKHHFFIWRHFDNREMYLYHGRENTICLYNNGLTISREIQ